MVLTILLLFLGINKQLDLQTLLNDMGRRMAKANGWYSIRRFYQVIFIATVRPWGSCHAGRLLLAGAQAVEAEFRCLAGHRVPLRLRVHPRLVAPPRGHRLQWRLLGLKWNWILELGGIGVTLVGALIALRVRGGTWPARGAARDRRKAPTMPWAPRAVQPGTWRPGLATGEP